MLQIYKSTINFTKIAKGFSVRERERKREGKANKQSKKCAAELSSTSLGCV
jgi:hypothetical protein